MFRFLFILFIIVSCSVSRKKAESTFSKDTNVCNMNVSFRSLGAGIDRKSYKSFLLFIEQFENVEKVKLTYEQIFWGREGEMDYCFHYSKLTDDQIIKFEKEIKELFIESKSVYYSKETEKRKGR
jgi:hypothetical protein